MLRAVLLAALAGVAGASVAGLQTSVYTTGGAITDFPDFASLTPVAVFQSTTLNFDNSVWAGHGFSNDFASTHKGDLVITRTGRHTFFLSSDDGSRLYIDGNLVIDNGGLHSAETVESALIRLTAGTHTIEVQFFEHGGNAVLQLEWIARRNPREFIAGANLVTPWDPTAAAPTAAPPTPVPGVTAAPTLPPAAAGGLQSEAFRYTGRFSSMDDFPDYDAMAPFFTWRAETIDYVDSTWQSTIGYQEQFATRHRGFLRVPTTGDYTFYLASDDGSLLYLDGALVIDNGGLHSEVTLSTTLTLSAGDHPIDIRYFERTGVGILRFEWIRPGQPREVVPVGYLMSPDATPAPPTLSPPTPAPPTAVPTPAPPTPSPPTPAPPTPAPPTPAPPTPLPPTAAPPTPSPPTPAPPTAVPTPAPPTPAPPTAVPTPSPPTPAPPTAVPTPSPPTPAPPTAVPTLSPPTPAPPTAVPTPSPPTPSPPTAVPTPAPLTPAPPTAVPTPSPPTPSPPTAVPTPSPLTPAPPTAVPTPSPLTPAPPTAVPTPAPPTPSPPTAVPTPSPPTPAPPTAVPTPAPLTPAPPTAVPTPSPPTPSPPTAVPTPAPATPLPPTPSPTPVGSPGGSGLQFQVKTGDNLPYGSVGTMRVYVYTTDGGKTEISSVAHPDNGELTVLDGPVGKTAADVKGLELVTTHPDGWFVEYVAMWDGAVWEHFGLPKHHEQEFHWIDSDNERTPTNLYFTRKTTSALPGSNAVTVRITTGSGASDGSSGTFPVRLHYTNGDFYDAGSVTAPAAGSVAEFALTTAPQPASSLVEVEVYDSTGGMGWRVQSLEVDAVKWVLPAQKYSEGHVLDRRRLAGAAKVLRFVQPVTSAPGASHTVNLRVTTGSGPAQGSTETFPVSLRTATGLTYSGAAFVGPLSGEVRVHAITGVPFTADDVVSVTFTSVGEDDWFVGQVEVQATGGSWSAWGLRDHHYRASRWVCGACGDGRATSLAFVPIPSVQTPVPAPASAPAGSNTVRIRITTGSSANAASSGTFQLALQGKDATYYNAWTVGSPVSGEVRDLTTTTSPVTADDLRAVWVFHGGAEGWRIVNLEVEQGGTYNVWKVNGHSQRWIDGDNPETLPVLVWVP